MSDGWITWTGGECPVKRGTLIDVKYRDGAYQQSIPALESICGAFRIATEWGNNGRSWDIVAYRVVGAKPDLLVTMHPTPVTAPDILDRAGQHMRDRAATYDSPGGERSMARTVAVFNALHGLTLSEEQGWSFMACLKQVRLTQQRGYHADSAEDLAAYVALMAEARARA